MLYPDPVFKVQFILFSKAVILFIKRDIEFFSWEKLKVYM